ncbi:PAS domain S-box protein [Halovenus sp. WSH3]|uniref:histidine kinase n=1 Tax=Halovenus carboxidivorans TaxID=2692199 RepID=A0A6B0T6J9_9EURY|nr:ATP-binding protein [Halovenus carboxidivorans]MXR50510.1 PAS domain S-box protein [Halovenus carboxidivorans]
MTTPLDTALFGIAFLSGVLLCTLGAYCNRRWDEPGVTAFGMFTLLLGIGAVVGGAVGMAFGASGPSRGPPLWSDIAFLSWAFAMLPWLVFALEYTGTYTRLRRRTVALLSLPLVGVTGLVFVSVFNLPVDGVILQTIGSLATVHVFFLLIIGIYLVVRTTHEYGHLSLGQGIVLGTAAISPLFILNITPTLLEDVGLTAAATGYAVGFLFPAGLLVFALFGFEIFESTPAAGTVGEQAIARETDDLIFVVDDNERVIKLNPKAAEEFGLSRTEPLGKPISDILGVTLEELRGMETYERRSGVSRQQFDPEISSFTDQHDRQLGCIISLHDVTERELRKQRLEVLNRVLRHNLRNNVDVIKSNAEVLAENGHDDRAEAIIDSADGLADLGHKARSIDRFVSRRIHETERDLVAVAEEVIADRCERSDNEVEIELDAPESASLVTDWEALTAALDSSVGNAVRYADTTVEVGITEYATGYRITVSDDGPGIPDSELAALDAGSETPLQHGTGLGLWRIKWGIKKLNGTVTFTNESGTTVQMTVPDRSVS